MAKHSGSSSSCACSKPTCSDFGFNTSDPGVFLRSQWSSRSRYIFLMYRVLFACYVVFCESYILYKYIPLHGCYTLIFFPKWTFIVLTCYSLLAMFGAIYHKPATVRATDHTLFQTPRHNTTSNGAPPKPPRHQQRRLVVTTPWIFKLSWLLFNICLVVHPFVTAVFWTSVYSTRQYDYSTDTMENTLYFVMDIHEHGVGAFLVYLDLIVSATPIRVAHLIYGVLFTALYIAFTAGFWALGETTPNGQSAIYFFLDWDTPIQTAYYISGAMGVIVVLHLLGYGVYKLRTSCYKCMCGRSELPFQLPRQPQMEYIELGKEDGTFVDAPLADFESF